VSFRLTYASMFNPPEQVHQRFDDALAAVSHRLGATHALYIDGQDVAGAGHDERRSPIDRNLVTGRFAVADLAQVDRAFGAAHRAFTGWRALSVAKRAGASRT
jgi:delta 1-pyrroline-5-carboxylate dehydrogenase